jgi:hypothetical protein
MHRCQGYYLQFINCHSLSICFLEITNKLCFNQRIPITKDSGKHHCEHLAETKRLSDE